MELWELWELYTDGERDYYYKNSGSEYSLEMPEQSVNAVVSKVTVVGAEFDSRRTTDCA